MCGIVGYIGNKNAYEIVINGLKRLEYRGYDSSGVALYNSELSVYKTKGKVEDLVNKAKKANSLDGNIGIGHTRWATHGEPNDVNAHPILSNNKSLVIVHNGIIENYIDLKNEQLNRGYSFSSETDTEVIAHAIDFAMKSSGTLISSVQLAIKSFSGAYGLGIISSKYPDQIIATRMGSPLLLSLIHISEPTRPY